MYAIIRIGGRQYRAEVGQTLDVERLPNDIGDSIQIDNVLLIGNGDATLIGQPLVENAFITATIEEQFRGKKVIVFKYRQRTNYRVKRGHRQYHTRIRIASISLDGTVYDTPDESATDTEPEAFPTPTPPQPEDIEKHPEAAEATPDAEATVELESTATSENEAATSTDADENENENENKNENESENKNENEK